MIKKPKEFIVAMCELSYTLRYLNLIIVLPILVWVFFADGLSKLGDKELLIVLPMLVYLMLASLLGLLYSTQKELIDRILK